MFYAKTQGSSLFSMEYRTGAKGVYPRLYEIPKGLKLSGWGGEEKRNGFAFPGSGGVVVAECFEHRRRWFFEVCGETPSNNTRDACAPPGWCWISRRRSFPRGQNVFAQSTENSEEPDAEGGEKWDTVKGGFRNGAERIPNRFSGVLSIISLHQGKNQPC
jgi:hypothetical protein